MSICLGRDDVGPKGAARPLCGRRDAGSHGRTRRCRNQGRDQAVRPHGCCRGHQHHDSRRVLLLSAGAERLRQDDAAPHHRGPRGADRGRRADRRRIGDRQAHRAARHVDDVPELRALSASHRARQRRLQPEDEARGKGRAPRARLRGAAARAARSPGRPHAGAALRRAAAACRAGPLADHESEGAAARRAAVGAGRVPAPCRCAPS